MRVRRIARLAAGAAAIGVVVGATAAAVTRRRHLAQTPAAETPTVRTPAVETPAVETPAAAPTAESVGSTPVRAG
jgi:hypothetical protein